jgi:hypothetical protein
MCAGDDPPQGRNITRCDCQPNWPRHVALPAKKVRSLMSSEVILPIPVGNAAHALAAVTIGYERLDRE